MATIGIEQLYSARWYCYINSIKHFLMNSQFYVVGQLTCRMLMMNNLSTSPFTLIVPEVDYLFYFMPAHTLRVSAGTIFCATPNKSWGFYVLDYTKKGARVHSAMIKLIYLHVIFVFLHKWCRWPLLKLFSQFGKKCLYVRI